MGERDALPSPMPALSEALRGQTTLSIQDTHTSDPQNAAQHDFSSHCLAYFMADSDMSTEVAHLLQDHILACGDPSHGLKEKLIIMSHFRIKENKA